MNNIRTITATMKTIPKPSEIYFATLSCVIGLVTLERKSSALFLSISAC
jgi:hypothetical protein